MYFLFMVRLLDDLIRELRLAWRRMWRHPARSGIDPVDALRVE